VAVITLLSPTSFDRHKFIMVCVVCGDTVHQRQHAIECDLCENWCQKSAKRVSLTCFHWNICHLK